VLTNKEEFVEKETMLASVRHRVAGYDAFGSASALEINPRLTTAFYNRGNLRLNLGDLDGALADFDQALQTDPDDVMAYNNRGIAKLAKGDLNGAIEDFNHAIKINSRHPEPYANRGLVRLQQGKNAEAERDFARSIALQPSVRLFIARRVGEIRQQQ